MKFETLTEAVEPPKVLLVLKRIWLNFEKDDSTVLGWQTKMGDNPHGERGLYAGDILAGVYHHGSNGINYSVVVNGSQVVKGLSPEFLQSEIDELVKAKVLKVLLK